jgi:uncharacterized damage-inducible protein DinB
MGDTCDVERGEKEPDMTQPAIVCWEFYSGWEAYQDHLVQAVTPLTADQLRLGIAPHLRTIGQLVGHIVRTRATWLHLVMGEGGADIAAIARWPRDGDLSSAGELVIGLELTFAAWRGCLQRWTPADLAFVFRGEHAGEPYELSRQWIIWHVIEHDLHHGGEFFFSLGAHGLETPDI